MTEIESQVRIESKCDQLQIVDIAEAEVCVKEAACSDTAMSSCAPVDVAEMCNSSELVLSTAANESEFVVDNMQLDSCAECRTNEVVTEVESLPCLDNNVKDVLDNAELVPCSETQSKEVESSVELESCSVTHAKEVESSRELEPLAESQENERENGHCLKIFANEAPEGEEVEPKEDTNDAEMEPCGENHELQVMDNVKLELLSSSDVVKEAQSGLGLESCPKSKATEASTDDIYSEVSNPNLSPKHVASTLTVSSQAVDVLGIDRGGCGEITSAYSQNLCLDGSLDKEECIQNQKTESTSKSCVVLEIPKHISTTGIRKITFKFSKRKEKYDSESTAVKPIANNDVNEAYYDNHISVSAAHLFGNAELNGSEFHDTKSSLSSFSSRELKMSKKIMPDNYPTNVKKLLSTRILEGARVKYISMSGEKEIPGIIKDCGYACGCCICNFSRVVSAYEFELHAGTKTRHPNNHIYLENGKPIYSIIEEMRTAPVSTLDDVVRAVAGSSVNEEYFQVWKANLQCSDAIDYVDQSNHYGMYPSNTRYHIQPTEDDSHPPSYQYYPLIPFNQQSYIEAAVDKKRCVKKPRHHFSSSAWEKKKASEGGTKKRDNDLHKLLFMPNGLPDGTDLAYYSKGKRILGGYKQGNGIACSCCNTVISPSQFEAHAGWAAKRQPYRNIYISSGLALHDIALMLVNGQNRITCGNDDMCAICGDGGELIICNGCPRAYHAACLGLWNLPADGWHCPHCNDKFGPGRKVCGESRPIIIRLTRVVKAPELEPGGCVLCRSQDFSAAKFDDRTVILCDQCEKEYHVGCLRESGFCDLKELPKDKWFCCDDCDKIFAMLQNLVSGGPEVAPASVLSAIYTKHAAVGVNDGSNNEITWRILSGKSRFPEHLLLLSQAAAIFRECFDPIVAASGRDLIPVMVYGRNISGQEFSGMYCVVLIVKSIVVSAALLRIFGREAAELPLAATGRENQGKGYFQALFSCIERLLLSMNVKHLVLPAAEEAEHMWTKKLGFRKTSNEQMLRYTRDLQLTMFKGTSLLEKELPQLAE